jgi:hypothetical protein
MIVSPPNFARPSRQTGGRGYASTEVASNLEAIGVRYAKSVDPSKVPVMTPLRLAAAVLLDASHVMRMSSNAGNNGHKKFMQFSVVTKEPVTGSEHSFEPMQSGDSKANDVAVVAVCNRFPTHSSVQASE